MGTSSIIDIAGSFLVSGLLLYTALQLDQKSTQTTFDSQAGLTVQQNMVALIENLQYDFRKIGYCANPYKLPSSSSNIFIQMGDTSAIWFLTDVSNSGNVDTVKYWLGNDSIPGCSNPRVRLLYRRVNSGVPMGSNLGVTKFNIQYFGPLGHQLSTPFYAPNRAHTLVMSFKLEPVAAYDTAYSQNFVVWSQTRLVARNLNR